MAPSGSTGTASAAQETGLAAVLRHDLPASLVVFLVALPLSLGIALASNAPIMAGVVAGVIGGVVAGALGGAPLQVSGPAAGLTALIFHLVEQCRGRGGWQAVCFLLAAAGLLQLALGAAKVARWALAISPSVVHGMLAGIGVLITLGQTHVVLGGGPHSSAIANLKALPARLAATNPSAAALGVATAAALLLWPRLPAAALRKLPAALVVIALATAASLPLGESVERITLAPPGTAGAARPGLLDALRLPTVPDLPVWDMASAVVGLCLIASVESLLSAVATDKLHAGPRADLNRELVGQGAANLLSGLVGGLPITGVIVRSKANIDAGGRTRASAVLHGVWLLVFVLLLAPVVEQIPKAVLAGLLVTVGVSLVSLEHIRDALRHGEAIPYFATVVGILAKDLLSGVALGFVVNAVMLLHRLTAMTVHAAEQGDVTALRIDGALTFRNVPELVARLGQVPAGRAVTVDLNLTSMDHAGWEALHAWRTNHEKTGARVVVDGLDEAFAPSAPSAPASPAGAPPEAPRP